MVAKSSHEIRPVKPLLRCCHDTSDNLFIPLSLDMLGDGDKIILIVSMIKNQLLLPSFMSNRAALFPDSRSAVDMVLIEKVWMFALDLQALVRPLPWR